MKVLIADDHIPDEIVRDDKIPDFVAQRFQSSDSALIDKFAFMRKMLNRLRDAGLNVHVCNHASLVEKSIKQNRYDAAVIDLGWYADEEVPENAQAFKGWDIIDMVREKSPLLPLIMYSSRLFENSAIARGAVDRGVLPVYKDFKETCIDNLIAVLHFVYSTREQVKRIDADTYKALSSIAKVMIVVALIFIVVGLGLLLFNKTEAGRLTAGLSLITAAMSGVFWKYLDKIRKNALSW
jgi:hypothetical protein